MRYQKGYTILPLTKNGVSPNHVHITGLSQKPGYKLNEYFPSSYYSCIDKRCPYYELEQTDKDGP